MPILPLIFIVFNWLPGLVVAEQSVNWGLGPVETENQFPLALNHASFRPMSPAIVEQGATELHLDLNWANTYILNEGNYTIDGESRVINLTGNYGASDALQLGVNLPLIWRGGGNLDSAIADFHKTIGVNSGARGVVPHGEFAYFGVNNDSSTFVITDDGFEFGDIQFRSKYLVSEGNEIYPALALVGELRLPTRTDPSYGQDRVDLTIGAVASKKWNKFVLYSGAAFIYYSDRKQENIVYEDLHYEGFLGSELFLSESVSLNASFYLASELTRSVRDLPGYQLYLDTGLKYAFCEDSVLELLLRENIAPSDGTTDVSFPMGVTTVIR